MEEPRPRVLVQPISVGSLVARFAIAGLVALVFVGAFTAFASRRIGTQQAIDEAKRVAFVSSAGIVTPLLGDDLLTMDREALDRIDAAVRSSVLRGSLVRVKIWAEDGTILYSDEPRLIGEQFEIGEDERAIFTSDEQGAEVSDLSKPENRFETDSKLLEVYLRTETPSGTPLLFEAYFRYSGVTDVGRHLWAQFAPITIGALVVLQLVQIPLAWSMARRLQTSQRERERLLRHALDASDTERRRIAERSPRRSRAGPDRGCRSRSRRRDAVRRSAVNRCSTPPRPFVRASSRCGRCWSRSTRPTCRRKGCSRPSVICSVVSRRGVSKLASRPISARPSSIPRPPVSSTEPPRSRCATRSVIREPHRCASTCGSSTDRIQLSVDDNGRGFSAETLDERAADGHVGLRALAGLVADLGGALTVRSAPGEGTRVEVSIPIDARLPR